MIGFFKKLFGRDADTNKEAGVQIEQVSPRIDLADTAITQRPNPTVAPAVAAKPKKQSAPKKQGGARPKTARKPRQPK